MDATRSVLFASLLFLSGTAVAQAADEEPVAIFEVGGAAGWSLEDHASSFGADLAVEVTPIEKWLELEAGTTPLFSHHSVE